MNIEIANYLIDWLYEKHRSSYPIDEKGIIDILVYSSEFEPKEICRSPSRWWDNVTLVGKYGDKYFQFPWAYANRDESIHDLGWEFDWSAVVEVEPYTEVVEVTKYRVILK